MFSQSRQNPNLSFDYAIRLSLGCLWDERADRAHALCWLTALTHFALNNTTSIVIFAMLALAIVFSVMVDC